MTHHDELAAVRHLIAASVEHGYGSDEEAAAEQRVVNDYLRPLADQSGHINLRQPFDLITAPELIAALRTLRLLYGQRQLMVGVDTFAPDRGIGESGLIEHMGDAIDALLTLLTGYLIIQGDLPETPEPDQPAPDPQLTALLRTMGGGNHA